MPANLSRPSAFSFFAFVLFVFSQGLANAATCVPATADGAGLQACLDSSAPGDTVLLQPGTYVPPTPLLFPAPQGNTFFIGKRLTIRGAGPGVVLSGDLGSGLKAFNVVFISASANPGTVTLENLSIQDGDSRNGGFIVGGGILAAADQTVSLKGVTLQHNQAARGGAIWAGSTGVVGATWDITDSTFFENVASEDGGAIYSLGAGNNVTITNSHFEGNSAQFSAGAILNQFGAGSLSISDSDFVSNRAGNFGGAVWHNSSAALSVTGSTFFGNSALDGGGAMAISIVGIFSDNEYLIDKSTFESNAAGVNGGAIIVFNLFNRGTISNSNFFQNDAGEEGGAIKYEIGKGTLAKSSFVENHAGISGGAVVIIGSGVSAPENRSTNMDISKNTFLDNSADIAGGAVFAAQISSMAPATPTTNGLFFTKNHYVRNSAGVGGGAVIVGLISSEERNDNIVMDKEHYRFNTSSIAGALGLAKSSGTLSDLHFNHNDAGGNADSLFVDDMSPELELGKVRVAGEDANDCLINGNPDCGKKK